MERIQREPNHKGQLRDVITVLWWRCHSTATSLSLIWLSLYFKRLYNVWPLF